MPTSSGLTVRTITTRGVREPLAFALGTSAAVVQSVPLLLADLLTEEGITGGAYLFCYTPSGAQAIAAHLVEVAELIRGKEVTPLLLAQLLLRRFALLGVAGPVRMALSVTDIALWDALAKSLGRPLAAVLGASPRPIRAYDSRGLGLMEPEKLADEAVALIARGLGAIKLRLGYPTLQDDLAALGAVRRRVPDEVLVMVDYNQALTPAEAILRGRVLQNEGIAWLEEPIRHDDYRGAAAIARALEVPIQIGENFNGPEAMVQALAESACDYVMPDVVRIGGVTGWIQAAGIAATHGVGAQLLSATPTAHWLEYVDWADAILEEPLQIVGGDAICSDRPGVGIAWDEDKLKRLDPI